jgi:hypothetical protein
MKEKICLNISNCSKTCRNESWSGLMFLGTEPEIDISIYEMENDLGVPKMK